MSQVANTANYSVQDDPYATGMMFVRKTSVEIAALITARRIGIGMVYYDTTSGQLQIGITPSSTIALAALSAAGAFTTLSASSTVSGVGFSTYMAAPPAIGTTTPGVVKTSNLQATYTDSTATPGNVTNNSPRGTVTLAAATSSITVTNSLVTASSTILTNLKTTDGAATQVVTVLPAAGSFTITVNGITTATDCDIDFLVVN